MDREASRHDQAGGQAPRCGHDQRTACDERRTAVSVTARDGFRLGAARLHDVGRLPAKSAACGVYGVERRCRHVRQSGVRIRVLLVGVAAALVAVTSCGSREVVPVTGSSPPPSRPPVISSAPSRAPVPSAPAQLPSGAHLIVVTADMHGPLTIALHDVIDVQLVSTAYDSHGVLVPWRTPTSSDPVVLRADEPASLPACPADASCTAFVAAALGVAKLQGMGPSGLLCDDAGANCVAVAAMGIDISVTVAPAT